MFEGMKISFLFYIIIVFVSIFALLIMGGYFLWNYHLGKSMAPFFWLRIQGWTQRGIALFEIFSLTNSVSLVEARKETGDGYKLYTPSKISIPVKKEVKRGVWSKIWYYTIGNITRLLGYLLARNLKMPQYSSKKVSRTQSLIMPKSTYSINGVNTIPLWDLHPQLHVDVLEGLKILIEQNIKTLTEFEEKISNPIEAEKILFKSYTYRSFYDLYLGVRQKYNVVVTTDDVANFIGKQFDKNFRESIEAKDFNAMQAQKTDNRYLTYGYIAIILAIVIVGFKIVWQTIH